jgi:hypothetical protein
MPDSRTRTLERLERAEEVRMLAECATSTASFDAFQRISRTWEQMAKVLDRAEAESKMDDPLA